MKQLAVIIGFIFCVNAQAIQPLSELPALPESNRLLMSCETVNFTESNDFGNETQTFKSFEVIQFGYHHSTIIGKTADGTKYLLSENVDEQIREFEPMRGFFEFEGMMNGESYYIGLWNDSDQPEAEMLVHRVSKSHFAGKILVLWDFTQEYTVTCR